MQISEADERNIWKRSASVLARVVAGAHTERTVPVSWQVAGILSSRQIKTIQKQPTATAGMELLLQLNTRFQGGDGHRTEALSNTSGGCCFRGSHRRCWQMMNDRLNKPLSNPVYATYLGPLFTGAFYWLLFYKIGVKSFYSSKKWKELGYGSTSRIQLCCEISRVTFLRPS